MAKESPYRYGTPNWEMLGRWLRLPPEDDGPFWALNLMKYRDVADYGDAGTAEPRSGRDADDDYAPLGPLAAVGAMVAFHGDVVAQPLGAPRWDRVGIVRYPTRAAFFAMQQRDDFKRQHVHKEAGMEFTIVMSCLPASFDTSPPGAGLLTLTVARGAAPDAAGRALLTFDVEGVIVGDERSFDIATFDRATDDDAVAALARSFETSSDEAHVVVVKPTIDKLAESFDTAPATGN